MFKIDERQRFHDRLRILMNLDKHDLPGIDDHVWENFKPNPHREFIRCDDHNCGIIWAALQKRELETSENRARRAALGPDHSAGLVGEDGGHP